MIVTKNNNMHIRMHTYSKHTNKIMNLKNSREINSITKRHENGIGKSSKIGGMVVFSLTFHRSFIYIFIIFQK